MYQLRRKLLLLQRRFWIYVHNLQIKYKTRIESRLLEEDRTVRDKKLARKARIEAVMLEARAKLIEEVIDADAFLIRAKEEESLFKRLIRKKLIRENGAVCEKCGRKFNSVKGAGISLDHIIPQSILRDMGFSVEDMCDERNFQLMCQSCNAQKGNSLDFTNPKTKPLLLEYLGRVNQDFIDEKRREEIRKRHQKQAKEVMKESLKPDDPRYGQPDWAVEKWEEMMDARLR